MNTTLKLCLLKRRKKANGEIPIYIRITQNRKYSLLSTGYSVESRFWNAAAGKVRSSHPSHKALNQRLEQKLLEINQALLEAGESIDRRNIVKMFQGGGRDNVYEYGLEVSDRLNQEGKYHPSKQTKAAASKFLEFAGKNVRFSEVTPQLLNEFQYWMATVKKNHPNTIVKTVGRLKAIFKEAYQNDITTNLPFDDPKFQRVRGVDGNKQALTIEQIKRIEALPLKGDLFHVRNYFMFSFWNAGIRFTDLALLKWSNIIDGRLIYTMNKNNKQKNIILLPEAQKILNHYRNVPTVDDFIFPIIKQAGLTELGLKKKAASANAVANRRLKEIQEMAGIQTNISFHIARHSFARWAKENKLDIDFIGAALAHSKRSTTERYLNTLQEYNLDEEMIKLAEAVKK